MKKESTLLVNSKILHLLISEDTNRRDLTIIVRLYYLYLDNKNPAPNAYELKSLMGQNFNSKYKSSQDKTMLGRYKDYDSRENCKNFFINNSYRPWTRTIHCIL